MAYATMQTSDDGMMHHGLLNYLKSGYLSEITPAAIDAIVENYEGDYLPAFWTQHLGGQVARVAPDATAFAHRNVHSNFGINAIWTDESESDQRIAALRKFYAAVEPHMAGFYTNLNDDTEKKTWGNYAGNYPRLVKIKSRYDPDNLFRLNANIRPEPA
jgi:FAD/FMN-containing dehydrogenase